jgi:hypothetical protein
MAARRRKSGNFLYIFWQLYSLAILYRNAIHIWALIENKWFLSKSDRNKTPYIIADILRYFNLKKLQMYILITLCYKIPVLPTARHNQETERLLMECIKQSK